MISYKKTCDCGEKIEIKTSINVCNACSTSYDIKGNMILSRHNWNVNEYFSFFLKNKQDPA